MYQQILPLPGTRDTVPVLRFSGFERFPGLVHAVFTRQGGVSRGRFRSLNLSSGAGDDPVCVAENLERVRKCCGFSDLVIPKQVHGSRVMSVEGGGMPHDCDAVITRKPGLGLLIRQADCAAVILYDPVAGAVGNVHSGWRGLVENVVGITVQAMITEFGCRPERMWAAQSPSLGPCCAEYRDHRRLFPEELQRYRGHADHFDFWRAIEDQLADAGIPGDHVSSAGICTRCNTSRFFSYRAEGVTGRFGTVAGISKDAGLRCAAGKEAGPG
ncbi:MAG: laccase domain-containing protein [Deltaproteobacteria bacterium]|nr:laccase domain-containing protein [Deltaproteobacteria bacterium]